MSVKDDAYEWGYNAAAGKAAYENEQVLMLLGVLGLLALIVFAGIYINYVIGEYKDKKIEERNRANKAKRKKIREESNGR